MKRIITGALVLALSVGAAKAQTASTGDKQDRAKKEHRMHGFDQLNLSDDQKARMKSLHEDQRKEMETLKNNKSLSADAEKTQREELHKKYKDQMQSILTPSQKEQLEKMKGEHKMKGKGDKDKVAKEGKASRKEGKGFGRGKDFTKELGLTNEQQQKMQQLRSDFRPKAEAIRNNASLSEDQKKEQMKELMKQQQEQMKTVLTKEQMEKMQSLRKERAPRNTK
jgi:Spy/CpxP family protein refolding chaperone